MTTLKITQGPINLMGDTRTPVTFSEARRNSYHALDIAYVRGPDSEAL